MFQINNLQLNNGQNMIFVNLLLVIKTQFYNYKYD